MPDWHVPAAPRGPQVGRPGTVPLEFRLCPTLRVFVSLCGNSPYDFRKTQSRDVPGTFGKISFLASDERGLPASGGMNADSHGENTRCQRASNRSLLDRFRTLPRRFCSLLYRFRTLLRRFWTLGSDPFRPFGPFRTLPARSVHSSLIPSPSSLRGTVCRAITHSDMCAHGEAYPMK